MTKHFKGVESAVDFLANESTVADRLLQGQALLAKQAEQILRHKGAYLLGISGLYGGMMGVIGSANRGTRIIQGTEPVWIGDHRLALHDSRSEDDKSIRLTTAFCSNSDYLTPYAIGVQMVAQFGGGANLRIPGAEKIEARHVEAAGLALEAISESLEDVVDENVHLKLPKIDTMHAFPADRVVDIRELESIPFVLL